MATSLGASCNGVALTHGSPSVRAMPPIVRTCSELLKSSSARSTLTCAFVGTARTWRGSRGRGGGGVEGGGGGRRGRWRRGRGLDRPGRLHERLCDRCAAVHGRLVLERRRLLVDLGDR